MHDMTAPVTRMRNMTIRNIPDDVAKALKVETTRRGLSLNRTVIQLIRQALGIDSGEVRSNGLAQLAGTWTDQDLSQFESAVAPLEQVDEELWR